MIFDRKSIADIPGDGEEILRLIWEHAEERRNRPGTQGHVNHNLTSGYSGCRPRVPSLRGKQSENSAPEVGRPGSGLAVIKKKREESIYGVN